MADFSELLSKRRSVRDYEDRAVSLDLIKKIIRDSCFAPSSGDGQPWRFIVVNNKEWIKKLSDESKTNILSFIELNPDASVKKYESSLRNKDFNVFIMRRAWFTLADLKRCVLCRLIVRLLLLISCSRLLIGVWVRAGSGLAQTSKMPRFGNTSGCLRITESLLRSLWGTQKIFRGGPTIGRPGFSK